jgi:thiamine biosynthesis lipoprotein
MGSPCELIADTRSRARAETLARITAAEAWRIEDKFSRYRRGNIVDRINTASGMPLIVDEETARLIDFSATLFYSSDGLFDITSGVLRRAWTFDGSDRVPDGETVAAVLANVGWQRVDWNAPVLALPAGMQIDFGGIGKEYAVDRAVSVLRERSYVPCLVNFGGDLAVTGPPRERSAWQVGLESLGGSATPAAGLVRLSAGALATSGDTHRYVQRDGIRYPHIFDPRTGWPVRDAPASVTVAADTCVQAGVYSTLAMLQGASAESFLEREGVRHWCLRR